MHTFTTSLYALFTACLFTIPAAVTAGGVKRQEYVLPILYPTNSTQWQTGEMHNVTWNIAGIPPGDNGTGTILLRYLDNNGPYDEHLGIDHLLARGFPLIAGSTPIVVPSVPTRDMYVVLIGNSGNISGEFQIGRISIVNVNGSVVVVSGVSSASPALPTSDVVAVTSPVAPSSVEATTEAPAETSPVSATSDATSGSVTSVPVLSAFDFVTPVPASDASPVVPASDDSTLEKRQAVFRSRVYGYKETGRKLPDHEDNSDGYGIKSKNHIPVLSDHHRGRTGGWISVLGPLAVKAVRMLTKAP